MHHDAGVRAQAAVTTGHLLEREPELSLIGETLDAVETDGVGRIVLISGEPGAGKTALLQHFCARKPRVVWGRCDPLFTPRPLGPFVEIAEHVGGELALLVERGALPQELAVELARYFRAQPGTMFVLEDVHWADEATLDAVKVLARRIDGVPVLVVATYREEELDWRHPLRVVLGDLPGARRVKLAPLSREAVGVLASNGDADPDELYRKTAGNPFFVGEAIAAGGSTVPDTVRDAVLARAARLGGDARALLEAVSAVPQQAEHWLLDDVVGGSPAALEECLASGMLQSDDIGVAFRHELARLAIEDSISHPRRTVLHERVLAALVARPGSDLARLAHHAEFAHDGEAVLRFAPEAGARASRLGSHREAAAQFARALRFADALPPLKRAKLLAAQARECFPADEYVQGTAALEEEVAIRRTLGDSLGEAKALSRLSEFLWCPGWTAESMRRAKEAVHILETLPPGRALANAYCTLASRYAADWSFDAANAWAMRGLELAEEISFPDATTYARRLMASCRGDFDELENGLELAVDAEIEEQAGHAYTQLAALALAHRRLVEAERHVAAGLVYCGDHGLELFRFYLLAYRAMVQLHRGEWSEATASAEVVMRVRRTSTTPQILALVVTGLVRARRGDPEVGPLLAEAWSLAESTGELARLLPIAVARAEVAWLDGDSEGVDDATQTTLTLALERDAGQPSGELAVWRRRAGLSVPDLPPGVLEPHRLELAGNVAGAATAWVELDCPYEAALTLAESSNERALRRALEELLRLDAQPRRRSRLACASATAARPTSRLLSAARDGRRSRTRPG